MKSKYTSGWPKNQNKCWYETGSFPPAGSKKDVLKHPSSSNIAIPPAKAGRAKSSNKAVNNTQQTNKGIVSFL